MGKEIRHIAFLVIPDATLLDITGPYEVFSQALEYMQVNRVEKAFEYCLHTLSTGRKRQVRTASGMTIQCTGSIRTIDFPIDTLFIPGVPNVQAETYPLPATVIAWIKEQSRKVRRICSVCTGSFFLAEAGVLAGRRVTTHWEKCNALECGYTDIRVDSDPIFIKDGHVYTSAGISSGMDLALALVEEDLDKQLALAVARQMVLYLKRPGSQSQYSSVLKHQDIDYQPIREICNLIQECLHVSMTVEELAAKVSMSPRNFARVFARETGLTPARYIDKLRVETACRYLVDTRLSFKEIALLCGLGSPDNMRKVFIKYIQISPSGYRENFGTAFQEK